MVYRRRLARRENTLISRRRQKWDNFPMATPRQACCTSPAAMCYWFAAALIAWGGLALIGVYWHPLRASSSASVFLAMAIGCSANFLRNRTFHCVIAAPLFLVVGILLLLSDVNVIQLNRAWLWPAVLVGVGIAFLLEWHYSQRPARP